MAPPGRSFTGPGGRVPTRRRRPPTFVMDAGRKIKQMSYAVPSVVTSGLTFAQAQAGGFPALVNGVALASALDGPTTSRVNQMEAGQLRPPALSQWVSSWLSGTPLDNTEFLTRLSQVSAALKAHAQAVDDFGALVASNPGTVAPSMPGSPQLRSVGGGAALVRTWP